jgi:cytochrome c-type biogenesis protein CcmH/NrfG
VLYRVGPEFGAEPSWMRDEAARAARVAGFASRRDRANWEWRSRVLRAKRAQREGRFEDAVADAEAAAEANPYDVEAWLAQGDAYFALGRLGPAQAAFTRALQIDMRRPEPRLGLGWVMFRAGERDVAAAAWRPVVEVADRPTLAAMAALFDSLGDGATSARVRRAIERAGP